jgi:subtilisin family serine protease
LGVERRADGDGVTIAIIDTGIDYTHAAFGGPGTLAAFADNDPEIVEAGTFPTAKVIGGYDFAGTNYDADDETSVPVPDEDPLDEAGHGSHVASTAAGMEVIDSVSSDVLVGSGVAPGASLYALKVFGAEGTTNVVVNALEWAMDPNGDGDLSDRVDVVNMSLGSPWGAASDSNPDVVATNMAVALGTVVVASAGNEGDSSYVTGAPAVADKAISVAASSTGFVTLPTVKYGMGSSVPYMPGNAFSAAVTTELVDVDAVDGNTQIPNPSVPGTFLDHGTGELCVLSQVADLNALTGKVALIQRGDCSFSIKILNAATRGAVGAIVYNSAAGGEEFISMLTFPATLPAGFTARSFGLTLKAAAAGTVVTVGPDREVEMIAFGTADQVAGFSSRGPRGYDSKLKPEISAPGVTITAAGMGTGDAGVSMGGTSMAAPHIAGVAALLLADDPSLTPEQVKAAIMGTAVDLDPGDPDSYQVVPRTGAGRVDALAAVNTTSLAIGDPDLVGLSWGLVEVGMDVAVRRSGNQAGAPDQQ